MSHGSNLPQPPQDSLIYEDEWLYVCLALYPMSKGHTVIVWKKPVSDLHNLSDSEYDYLMEVMDIASDALLQTLEVEKVYLLYMDEVRQVHWHLVPRYNEKGFNVFAHEPKKSEDFSLAPALSKAFQIRYQTRKIKIQNKT